MKTFEPGRFAPATSPPKRSLSVRMWRAETSFELRLLLRNGEQLLLALVLPVATLLGLVYLSLIPLGEPRVDAAVPGAWTLAVISAAFTSPAIATAFDRRYGVLKRLLGAGVPRAVVLLGKATSIAVVVAGQLVVLSALALLLGWRPAAGAFLGVLVVAVGVVAFSGLGLLVGGLFRAEIVLALANVLWLALIGLGGVIVPLASAPGWLAGIGRALPSGALSEALRAVLTAPAEAWVPLGILVGWAVVGWAATLQWFKWQ